MAFEDMRKKYEELKRQQAEPSLFARKEDDILLTKTAGYTTASLENSLSTLRRLLQSMVDDLASKISEEAKKLEELREVYTYRNIPT